VIIMGLHITGRTDRGNRIEVKGRTRP
jgi:hypothetical protein